MQVDRCKVFFSADGWGIKAEKGHGRVRMQFGLRKRRRGRREFENGKQSKAVSGEGGLKCAQQRVRTTGSMNRS
ncbi:hypothetical protein EXN66_Car000792 [Channa argus]|uniref:Uncharacterized protein n=1 Tax=Channa argus TaxID=215402 RepID=A0A6G1QZ75_CHAAH|nr:hypothetical protein EXN66_Car000792 [Channa argus]